MALGTTPYDQRIKKLRRRIKKRKGPNLGLQKRLIKTKRKQERHQRRTAPAPSIYDTQFETEIGQGRRNLQQKQADIAGQRAATEQKYGFGADKSNPFAVAKQLQEDYRTRQGKTLGSYARAGHLYSGALNVAKQVDRRNFEQALDRQQRAYQAELADLAREEMLARQQFGERQIAAGAESLERALQRSAELDEPAPRQTNYRKRLKKVNRRIKRRRKRRRRDNRGKRRGGRRMRSRRKRR